MPKPIERHLTSQSIQLTCTAYGIPFPSVTWTRLPATNLVASEVRLPLTNITTNMTTANNVSSGGFVTSTINLCNVQLSNAGRYRCSASNSASDSNSSYAFSLSITPQGIITDKHKVISFSNLFHTLLQHRIYKDCSSPSIH